MEITEKNKIILDTEYKTMKMIYKTMIIACLLTITAHCVVMGQQQALFTQYRFNMLGINPAFAGNVDELSLTAIAREQWTGFEGAPSTQSFTVNYPIKEKLVGVGLSIINDKVGLTNETAAYLSYAYAIPIGNQEKSLDRGNTLLSGAKLSFGLQGGINRYNLSLSNAITNGQGNGIDPTFGQDDISSWLFNIGAGVYFNSDRFFAGFSIPTLLNNTYDNNADSRQRKHLFLFLGTLIDLSKDVEVKPSVLLKQVNGAPIDFDVNAMFYYKKFIGAGLSYRSLESVDILFELILARSWRVGYSYDILTNDLNSVSGGSHEIVVNFRLIDSDNKSNVHPRYF